MLNASCNAQETVVVSLQRLKSAKDRMKGSFFSCTMDIICQKRPNLFSRIGDSSGILSTNSVEVLLTRF